MELNKPQKQFLKKGTSTFLVGTFIFFLSMMFMVQGTKLSLIEFFTNKPLQRIGEGLQGFAAVSFIVGSIIYIIAFYYFFKVYENRDPETEDYHPLKKDGKNVES